MNPLLERFIAEARDLLETADAGLLGLEKNPEDHDALNGLFRVVHTLKGSAGLFDIPPFIHVVHAGEDLLGAAREDRLTLDPDLIDLLLEGLDQVGRWIDHLESHETLPEDAPGISRRLSAEFRRHLPDASGNGGTGGQAATALPLAITVDWLGDIAETDRLAAFRAATGGRPVVAVDYRPDAQCFFSGEDPLHLLRQVPDLATFAAAPRTPWPAVGDDLFDAYACNLGFRLLTHAPRADVEHLFRYVSDQATIVPLAPQALLVAMGKPGGAPVFGDFALTARELAAKRDYAALKQAAQTVLDFCAADLLQASALRLLLEVLALPVPDPGWIAALIETVATGDALSLDAGEATEAPSPSPLVAPAFPDLPLAILKAQARILALPCMKAEWAGRLSAVSRTVSNILRATGREADIAGVESAVRAAEESRSSQPLLKALAMLTGDIEAPEASEQVAQPVAVAATRPAVDFRSEDRNAHRTLKVDQTKVDLLMKLIGEMVVAKNSLPFLARRAEQVYSSRDMGREIKDQYAVIDRITQEMQSAIMQVRMLPVAQMFQRFPRLVRDLARKLGKSIELVLEGEDTEADKNIIEMLGDPLLHIVRNSIDHGIEAPEDRAAAGKPETATVRLKAYQEGDTVVIEISDDGRGIDPEKVKAKAVDKGLIDEDRAAAMSDHEAVQLVFAAGFSTAEQVTDLSGRGVGMDVVRTVIDKAGGYVTLSSKLGEGTVVNLHLPLSMAVTRVMMVETAGRLFGVPMDVIVETVRLSKGRIRTFKNAETFVLREAIVPLVRLRELLCIREATWIEEEEAVLVVKVGSLVAGIIVDQFKEGIDIILKPFDGVLAGIPGYAGSALLGDGQVLLVLNLKELL